MLYSENTQNNKIHIVAGPTASGKTKYAIELAQKIDGELINVDSRQIYKYLDVGTNKGTLKSAGEVLQYDDLELPVFEIENSGINIHLLSFLEPDQKFDVYSFRELVYFSISHILKAGKTPILIGGTGLYIDAIMHPEAYLGAAEVVDEELRAELNELPVEQLQQRLEKLDQETYAAMNRSDQHNPRRLIRAIEKLQAVMPPESLQNQQDEQVPTFDFEVHYLHPPIGELTERINHRVEQMWQDGIVAEVENVLKLGFSKDAIALQGIGYREVLRYLDGEIDEAEAISLIQIAHRQYAKRQLTWFQKHL